jgi:hypothetical protein
MTGIGRHMTVDRTTARRIGVCVAFGIAAGALVHFVASVDPYPLDFAQVWYAARVVLHGGNPYAAIGPGRAFEWPWPLYYPLPAALVAVPFAPLPYAWAMATFAAIGAAAFTWALTAEGPAVLAVLSSLVRPAWIAEWIAALHDPNWLRGEPA